VCLLAVAFRVHADAPLVIAANRDEWLARPAVPLTTLDPGPPRVVGGKDLVAGGTWLAVNERGVVAGLTNLPSRGGADRTKRSRGELPLALARHADARAAAAAFVATFSPRDYNPAWFLVGDRDALFYIDMTGDAAHATELAPGLHVLENRPLAAASRKADAVRARLAEAVVRRGEAFDAALAALLASHDVPPGLAPDPLRPPETEAACVHAGPYGTRSSSIIVVPPGAGRPRVRFADGPPCAAPFVEASGAWDAA
jgi:uncharacterized protein with NRDE domain